MAPRPDVLSVYLLHRRWGISEGAVRQVTKRAGFPEGQRTDRHDVDDPDEQNHGPRVYSRRDIEKWEQKLRAAGEPLPGEQPRGPIAGQGGRAETRARPAPPGT